MRRATGRRRVRTRTLREDADSERVSGACGRKPHVCDLQAQPGKTRLRRIDGKVVKVVITGKTRRKRVYQRYYDEEAAKTLHKLWAFFGYIRGERLTPLVKTNIDAISRSSRFPMSVEARQKLTEISHPAVERLLKHGRSAHNKGRSTTKPGTLLKNQQPRPEG
jgi:hypothetical protein